jgi:hypothetical protein
MGAEVEPFADTNHALRIYPLAEAFGRTRLEVERRLQAWLDEIGWKYRIFGPDENGHGWTERDTRKDNDSSRTVWIYQPADPKGSFRDYAYTLAWRVTHEVAHALVNDELRAKYGMQGRRKGCLGDPLTLAEALRAVEWEHRAFPEQREILEKAFSVRITDEAFAMENLVNMADAVYRVLTGEFSSPGDLGIVPQAVDPDEVLLRAIRILCSASSELGLGSAGRIVTRVGSSESAVEGRLRRYRAVIPLPHADNTGREFPAGAVKWFEGELRRLAGGFRTCMSSIGTWSEQDHDEEIRVYHATFPVETLGAIQALLEVARVVFCQRAIFLECDEVNAFVISGESATLLVERSEVSAL